MAVVDEAEVSPLSQKVVSCAKFRAGKKAKLVLDNLCRRGSVVLLSSALPHCPGDLVLLQSMAVTCQGRPEWRHDSGSIMRKAEMIWNYVETVSRIVPQQLTSSDDVVVALGGVGDEEGVRPPQEADEEPEAEGEGVGGD